MSDGTSPPIAGQISMPMSGRARKRGLSRTLGPLISNRLVLAGALLVGSIVLMALLANVIAPSDPLEMNVPQALRGLSPQHWLGTDRFGRDVLSRVIHGSRISLWVGFASVTVAVSVGTLIGLASGFYGHWLDNASSRLMEVLLSFPSLLLAIAIAATLGPGINNAIVAIVIVYTPLFFRVARGSTLAERGREYIEAARLLGADDVRVIWRHLLPNVMSPLIVQASISFSHAILVESYLSYLGLGTQPPIPSWGTMLNEGRAYLEVAPWASIFPGLGIMAAVLGFNLLGDGLRDVLDPAAR
jgi:peptide/nickel transport system permease protein